jgi:molybdopterin synthase sulfur carrier subunit
MRTWTARAERGREAGAAGAGGRDGFRKRGRRLVGGADRLQYPAMATVTFTQQLRRFTQTPEVDTDAGRLREALEVAFAHNPTLRGYVLDDQGHLRTHVVVFVDGVRVHDRVALDAPLRADSRVFVLQALSGG